VILIAEGCERCEPRVAPSGPREGDYHFAARYGDSSTRVLIDGQETDDVVEAWAGQPGRVIRCALNPSGPRLCSCGPIYMHDMDAEGNLVELDPPGLFCSLVEYDQVEVCAA